MADSLVTSHTVTVLVAEPQLVRVTGLTAHALVKAPEPVRMSSFMAHVLTKEPEPTYVTCTLLTALCTPFVATPQTPRGFVMAYSVGTAVRVADQHSEYRDKRGKVQSVDGQLHQVRLVGHGCSGTVPLRTDQLKADLTAQPISYTQCN